MRNKGLVLSIILAVLGAGFSQKNNSLVQEVNGILNYTADSLGNVVPDFSAVGYKNGEEEIPTLPVVKILSPVEGDNLRQIQSAIKSVGKLPVNEKGFRGAILLKKGEYPISNSIYVKKSGVLLIGEGDSEDGTIIRATKKEKHDALIFEGRDNPLSSERTEEFIITDYVAIGQTMVEVEDASDFKTGDPVLLRYVPKPSWFTLLGTDKLSELDPNDRDWDVPEYIMEYKRKVVLIDGNKVTLDAPVIDPINKKYTKASLLKYSWKGKLEQVGVEKIRFVSDYLSDTDEKHGWSAVVFEKVMHGWVRDIEAHFFGYGTINIKRSSAFITVDNARNIDPKSKTIGGRKYSFSVAGQRNLIKNCYSESGRHDFVTSSRTLGPNVFLNCTAVDMKADIGPHHRWASGVLFDNMVGDGEMNARNRTTSGSGHGWSGAQIMYWNCTAKRFRVQDPPGNHINWCVGCIGKVTADGGSGYWATLETAAYQESTGNKVIPKSLYLKQLADRLKNKEK